MKAARRSHEDDEFGRLVTEIQKSLDEIRLLLLRIRCKSEINELTKGDIDGAIEELEQIKGRLPDLSKSSCSLNAIFGLIKKVLDIRCRVFGD